MTAASLSLAPPPTLPHPEAQAHGDAEVVREVFRAAASMRRSVAPPGPITMRLCDRVLQVLLDL